MTLEMRRKLAREPFEEKIRKVNQLLRLVKSFPRRPSKGIAEQEALKKGMEEKSKEFVEKGAEVCAKA